MSRMTPGVIELPVRGMDCASCAAHVRAALESVDGVASADVRLAGEKAVVTCEGAPVDRTTLAAAVERAGYRVPPADDDVRDTEPRRAALRVFGLVAGVVLLVVVLGEWLGLVDTLTAAIPFPVGVFVVLLIGWPAFVGVARATRSGRVTSHTLMTVGVLAALVIGQWVTAAIVAFFMRVGDHVEKFTMDRGRRALEDLAALAPETARVVRDGVEAVVPVSALDPGDVVAVRPGERIPADGVVLEGRAAVEQAAITGESMPVDVEPGTRVHAATIPRGGSLRVRVERTGEEATFGRIVRMVEDAEASRGAVQSFADRFSGWYLPIVGGIALLTFVIRRDPLATAAVLVVACSCAFAIATPVAMLASIGTAARRGLLIKGGAAIEALARADVVLLDKTGTLTLGRPSLGEVVSLDGVSPDDILRFAASAERDSEHPLAEAVRRAAADRALDVPAPTAFEAREGSGVAATVEGRRIVVGSERAVGLVAPPEAGRLRDAGMSTALVAIDGVLAGVLGLRDELRDDVPAAIAALRDLGVREIHLLTGDHAAAAAPIAERLGIVAHAGLLPQDKIRIVREHQERGRTVVMIGDGINDAPALARADVGIAMGAAGSDLALEVAHVALLRDDWSLVPDAFLTARRTMGIVKGNFALTGAYNLLGLSLAALGILPPILAAAAQSIPDLGILGNSARLLRTRR